MPGRKSYSKFAIVSLFTLSFLTACLPRGGTYASFNNTNQFSGFLEKKTPQQATTLEFFHSPQVSNKYIRHSTTPGEEDYTLLTFSANQAVNYTVKISASYDVFPSSDYFLSAKYGVYRMDNGTWLIAAQPGNRSIGEQRNIYLGIGQNPTSFSWQALGLANNTEGIAVASIGSQMCVVYLEKNQVDNGGVSSWPVRWVKYFSSNDFGNTWENGTLWDCSAWNTTRFSGISMDVTSAGLFECMWGFSNTTAQAFTCGTIWEARKAGSGTWSTASNLTAFSTRGVWAVAPQVMFNHTNDKLYVCVNNVSSPLPESIIYELANGPDAVWTRAWSLETFIGEKFTPAVICALDDGNNYFYFVNATIGGIDGVGNASSWKAPIGEYDFVETRQNKHTFFLFAHDGPRMFTDSAITPIGESRPGILDASSPLCFYQYNGALEPVEEKGISFNGEDSLGNDHNARAYSFYVNIQSDISGSYDSYVYIGVDDTFPSLNVTSNTNFISPITSLGSNDSLQLDLISNKSGKATLRVKSQVAPVQAISNITNEVFSYINPALCGDGITYLLFYCQIESSSLSKLMMAKSTDGGLSWGDSVEVDTDSKSFTNIHPVMDGNLIYCWYQNSPDSFLLASFNGGETFVKLALPEGYKTVAEDKSVWWWQAYVGAESYNLTRSLDLGFTWETFISIPADDIGLYTTLESVAFDSQSGNYSFVFTNKSMAAMAMIADHDGTNKIVKENIAPGGSPNGGSYGGDFQVDAWRNSSGDFSWIVTCSDYYPIDMNLYSAPLASCELDSSGSLSSWGNFTLITGSPLPVLGNLWDLIIPTNNTPCYARSILDINQGRILQVEVYTATSFVYSTTIQVDANNQEDLSFGGISSIGELLPEGLYEWTITFVDQVDNGITRYGTVRIDHSFPILGNYANLTTPGLAVPRLPCTVTIPVIEPYLSHAILHYENGSQGWNSTEMILVGNNFTQTIPALYGDIVYWWAEIFNMAGNSFVVENNGQPFSYIEPQIRIEQQSTPPARVDLSLQPSFNVSFVIPEFSQYISYLYIEYVFDDSGEVHTASLQSSTQSIFYYTFDEIPVDATELNYTVYAVDLYGKITALGNIRTIDLIPVLPAWTLSPVQQLFALIASLAVGIFTGLVYASLTRKRIRPIPKRETSELETFPTRMEGNVSFPGYTAAFIITSLFIVGSLIGAFYFLEVVKWFEAAMLCFLGTFLATTIFWILFMDHSTLKVFRQGRHRIRVTLPLLVGFSIFIALVAMFMVGNNVAWWRVRINENPYMVFGIILPQLMTTLVATFFSSIIFLTRSIAKDVQRISKELADAELHNENPGRIFKRRETACQDILKSIGQKGVIFVLIIGITIVFASDLSAYAVQGILIILPFAGGALLTLFILSLRMKIKEKHEATLLYDKLTACPKCGKETTLGGSFCEHCGEALIKGTRMVPAEACPACGQLTPEGSSHCRYCNALLGQKAGLDLKSGIDTSKKN